MDKGYQGVQKFIHGIHSHKKPQSRNLPTTKDRFNIEASSDRIIVLYVEHLFGRMSAICTEI